MKKFCVVFMVTLLLAGFALPAEKKSKPAQLPLEVDEYFWQFGMIPRDAWVSHHYALSNTHNKTVTITEIVNDCDCTHLPKTPIAIKPGETYLLKVLFDTKTYFGETNRDIHLVTDYKRGPEMSIYFTSLASRLPNTISVTPRMTAFITGKNRQQFTIENLTDEKTQFKVFIDNDSTLTVSDSQFTLKGKQKQILDVSPVWDRIPNGSHYSCLVIEVSREESFRVSIPIKINRF